MAKTHYRAKKRRSAAQRALVMSSNERRTTTEQELVSIRRSRSCYYSSILHRSPYLREAKQKLAVERQRSQAFQRELHCARSREKRLRVAVASLRNKLQEARVERQMETAVAEARLRDSARWRQVPEPWLPTRMAGHTMNQQPRSRACRGTDRGWLHIAQPRALPFKRTVPVTDIEIRSQRLFAWSMTVVIHLGHTIPTAIRGAFSDKESL
ncbi:hypothetical protein GY45DRAFT_1334189 [Cubamyces sp. BRFM 1775]|nr:hypothetical protein GY45DRAFT_1334189 [Cubamyces sp. BRFM 1775]